MVFMLKLKKLLKLVSISSFYFLLCVAFFFIYSKKNSNLLEAINYPISCDQEIPYWLNDLLPNFQRNGYKGVQLSYQDKYGNITNCSVGWASLFPPRRMKNSDQIMYASISKVFTSALILNATQEKKLDIDDNLLEVLDLPNAPSTSFHRITIKHLLQHRAGFDRSKSGDLVFTSPNFCPDGLKDIDRLKLDYEPDQDFSYSNFGYCLLGEIIRKTYDDKLIDIYQKKLFIPAKAEISHVKDTKGTIQYYYQNEEPLDSRFMNKNFTAYGGFVGSASSFSKVINMLLTDSYIKEQMMEYADDCIMNEFYKCHGLTFYTYKQDKGKISYWRDGSLPGVSTLFMLSEDGASLVLLANSRSENAKQDHIELGKKMYQILQ